MRIIIVGGNHAGIAAALRIREEYPDDEVIVFEKKDEITFVSQKIPLFLMGHQDIHSQANYATPHEIIAQGVDLRIQKEVTNIDAKKKTLNFRNVLSQHEHEITYDRLIMAAGSYPNLPPTGGKLNETLFLLKERKDAEAIEKFISEAHHAVVIGAGLVGVEIARILAQRKMKVTLIQSNARILDKYLDENAAIEVEKQLEEEGIQLLLGTRVTSYHTIDKKIWSRPKIEVETSSDLTIRADGVFVSVGFRPNSFLLAGQVETGDRGAIVVDKYMYTTDDSILAIGDCSTTYMDLTKENIYNPHASDAFRQGLIAAVNIHEKKQEVAMTTGTYKFNMDGFTIANTGITLNQARKFGYDAEEVHYQNRYLERGGQLVHESIVKYSPIEKGRKNHYSSIYLVYEKKTKKILGLQVLGTVDISQYVNIISLAIQKNVTVPEIEFTDFFYEHGYKNPLGFTKILASLVREKKERVVVMAKKKDQMKLNKPDKEMSKKQKRMIEAGALLTVGAGAFIGGVTIPNLSASADSSSLSEKRLVEDETIQDIEHTSVDELNQSLQKGQSSSVKTNTGFVAKLMDQLPSKEKLSSMYEGEGIKVSDSHTAYDIQQILGIKDADVYYQTSTLSTSDAQVMKMSSYRQLIQANPNVKVTSQDNYKTVSPHLYESKEKAYEDSANWKDSKVVASTREKSLSFSSKTKPESTNFTADDGAVLGNMKIDTGFSLNVKAENGQAKLTDEIKSDFEDAMEKNFSITYEGSTYYAVYHDESISTDHGKNQADGYFTFSSSTHGLPLEINGHYLVSPVQFGSTVDSLKTSLSLHGVRSFENTDSWLNTDESNINVKVNFVDQLADENTTYYEIQAKDQVIESLKYEYVTVSLDEQKATDSTTAYADEMSMPTYSGSQSGISPGGAVDGNLAEDAAGLAGWNQTATFSGGGYGGHTITANSAVTVKTGQVSQTNFSSVISTVNITVDGVSYNQFVAQPIMVNGVQYAGYLTGANGSGSDFTIVVKDTNFNIYQIGGAFAYISSSMTDMASPDTTTPDATTPDATTPDATNPQVTPGTTTPEVDSGTGGGETTDPGTTKPEVDPGAGGGETTDPGTTTPEVDPGTGGGETTDPGTGTPEVDPGTGGETDPGTTTPEVDPGTGDETDPGTTTPEVNPGTGGETDQGTTTPEVDPGTGGGETDPGTTTPEVDPGTGGETDPGTTTPEVDPGTGGETDPGTTTPEVDPGTGGETDPGTTTPEVDPGTGDETDPETGTPEVDPTIPDKPDAGIPSVNPVLPSQPGASIPGVDIVIPDKSLNTVTPEIDPLIPINPGTVTPEVDPGAGGETEPGTGTPEVVPGTGGGETDPDPVTPEVDPGTGGDTDPGTTTPEVDPGTGGETDPGTGTPEVDPGTGGGETDPDTGTPEIDPGTGGGETDPGTTTPEVEPSTGGETDPETGTPGVDPGTGGETDPGTTTPEVDSGTGGETDPGTGTPEVDPSTGGETDPGTGTPEVDPSTGGETDPGTGTPEVDPSTGGETDPGTGTPEVDPGTGDGETDLGTTTPEVNPRTGGGGTDLSSTTTTETTDTDNQIVRTQVLSDNSSNDGLSSNNQTNDQTTNTQGTSDSEDVSGKQLPKTGSTSGIFGKFVGGILVVFAGFFGLFKRKRRELQKDEDRVERVIKEEDEEQENKEENKDKK